MLVLAIGLPVRDAAAQDGAPAAVEKAATPAEIDRLLSTLEDPARRDELIASLKALKAAEAKTAPPEETLGVRVLSVLSDRVESFSEEIAAAGRAMADTPRALRWLNRQVSDPALRERWIRLGLELAVAIAAGYAARWIALKLLSRPRGLLENRETDGWSSRLPLLIGRTVLDAVPIVAFAAAGFGALSVTGPPKEVRVAALTFINASIVLQLVLLAARAILAPGAPKLRLPRIGDETAEYGTIWTRRVAFTAIYGYFVAQAALLLGLPHKSYFALLKVVGLAVVAMLIVLVLQNRGAVAAWMRGTPLTGPPAPDPEAFRGAEAPPHAEAALGGPDLASAIAGETPPPAAAPAPERRGPLRSVRRRLADVWHVLAILYLVVIFGVWALEIKGGFEYVLRATIMSALVLLAARLLARGVDRLIRLGFAIAPDLRRQYPGLEPRANRYLPLLHRILKAAIWVAAALVLLNAWGVDSLGWLETPFGRQATASSVSIVFILVLALLSWEIVSAAIESYLTATDTQGQTVERSARVRTLLPLLRNAFMVLLITLVTLTVLSEIGLDIAPLLAGAGVVGLAIGFGAQTLVKDLITGMFILFEDTIAIGDVIDVGGGHSGVVEAISIRTLRLRDATGAVHSVPFSAVATVKNLTKDFSFAVFDIGVDYRQDTDRVTDVLKALGEELQNDPAFAGFILAPLEIQGLDAFQDSAVVIKARFKTRPMRQWSVAREFNRRMKRRFDQEGIEIPFPQRTVHVFRHGPDEEAAVAAAGASD
jgi:small conductance mechanosensitive channel